MTTILILNAVSSLLAALGAGAMVAVRRRRAQAALPVYVSGRTPDALR